VRSLLREKGVSTAHPGDELSPRTEGTRDKTARLMHAAPLGTPPAILVDGLEDGNLAPAVHASTHFSRLRDSIRVRPRSPTRPEAAAHMGIQSLRAEAAGISPKGSRLQSTQRLSGGLR
jgi:hypothetical protein